MQMLCFLQERNGPGNWIKEMHWGKIFFLVIKIQSYIFGINCHKEQKTNFFAQIGDKASNQAKQVISKF